MATGVLMESKPFIIIPPPRHDSKEFNH